VLDGAVNALDHVPYLLDGAEAQRRAACDD
jgi:hypothetical protein